MGMCTRLELNIPIRDSAPDSVIDVLRNMVYGGDPESISDSAFSERMRWMFRGSSYYHDNINFTQLAFDEISKCWKLSVVCDIKNYEREIERFVDWIAPHVEDDGHVVPLFGGYRRYEEASVPDLLYFVGGKALWYVLPEPAAVRAAHSERP